MPYGAKYSIFCLFWNFLVHRIVNKFCYLGFILTVQLSFTQHLEAAISKARARIGLLFSKLPIQNIPLHLVIDLFNTYIAPIFHYGLVLWVSKCSQNSMQALDAVWSKYLKRYLGLPPHVNNATVYHITGTEPFSNSLKAIAPQRLGGLSFPECFSGMMISFINEQAPMQPPFDPIPQVPTTFWASRMIVAIPSTKYYRHRIMREIFDMPHFDLCSNSTFHNKIEDDCVCMICKDNAHAYHVRYCVGQLNDTHSEQL